MYRKSKSASSATGRKSCSRSSSSSGSASSNGSNDSVSSNDWESVHITSTTNNHNGNYRVPAATCGSGAAGANWKTNKIKVHPLGVLPVCGDLSDTRIHHVSTTGPSHQPVLITDNGQCILDETVNLGQVLRRNHQKFGDSSGANTVPIAATSTLPSLSASSTAFTSTVPVPTPGQAMAQAQQAAQQQQASAMTRPFAPVQPIQPAQPAAQPAAPVAPANQPFQLPAAGAALGAGWGSNPFASTFGNPFGNIGQFGASTLPGIVCPPKPQSCALPWFIFILLAAIIIIALIAWAVGAHKKHEAASCLSKSNAVKCIPAQKLCDWSAAAPGVPQPTLAQQATLAQFSSPVTSPISQEFNGIAQSVDSLFSSATSPLIGSFSALY